MYRVTGRTDIFDLRVILDLPSDLVKVDREHIYYFTIAQDRAKASEFFDPKDEAAEALFRGWDYVAHGTTFETKETGGDAG